MGKVVDPEPVHPRTVSMSWAEPCDVEVRAASAPCVIVLLCLSVGFRFKFGIPFFPVAVMSKHRKNAE